MDPYHRISEPVLRLIKTDCSSRSTKIAHPTEIRKIEIKNNRYLCQGLQNDVIYMNKNVIPKAYLVSQQRKKKTPKKSKLPKWRLL